MHSPVFSEVMSIEFGERGKVREKEHERQIERKKREVMGRGRENENE